MSFLGQKFFCLPRSLDEHQKHFLHSGHDEKSFLKSYKLLSLKTWWRKSWKRAWRRGDNRSLSRLSRDKGFGSAFEYSVRVQQFCESFRLWAFFEDPLSSLLCLSRRFLFKNFPLARLIKFSRWCRSTKSGLLNVKFFAMTTQFESQNWAISMSFRETRRKSMENFLSLHSSSWLFNVEARSGSLQKSLNCSKLSTWKLTLPT